MTQPAALSTPAVLRHITFRRVIVLWPFDPPWKWGGADHKSRADRHRSLQGRSPGQSLSQNGSLAICLPSLNPIRGTDRKDHDEDQKTNTNATHTAAEKPLARSTATRVQRSGEHKRATVQRAWRAQPCSREMCVTRRARRSGELARWVFVRKNTCGRPRVATSECPLCGESPT